MNEITSWESETPIGTLLEEVLCLVFDHLDLWSVKNASLTCRRWHDIIFLSGYINRFKFQVDFPWACSAKANEENFQMMLEELKDTVNHTQRRYRNMHLLVRAYTAEDFPLVWECLHPKVTESIYSLNVELLEAGESTFDAVSDSITLMSKLRSLSLTSWSPSFYFKTLRNSSVQHLQIEFAKGVQIDMPELKSIEGPLEILEQACYNPQEVVLSKLKQFSLSDYSESYLSPLHRLAALETLQIITVPYDNLCKAICDTCKSLQELYFRRGELYSDPALFKHLSKLVNLRILKFNAIKNEENGSFYSDIDLLKLSHLEELDLGWNGFWEPTCLIRLPESIKILSVPITVETEENLIQFITGSLPQLRKLHLCYPQDRRTAINKCTLKSLPQLKQLEELSFINVDFSSACFLEMGTPMYQLRELRLIQCITDGYSIGLREIFPNLKQLEIN